MFEFRRADENPRAQFAEQFLEAMRLQFGIEGHGDGAGFKDAIITKDIIRAIFTEENDAITGLDAGFDKGPGQLIGPAVEGGIRGPAFFKNDGRRVRARRGAPFEKMVQENPSRLHFTPPAGEVSFPSFAAFLERDHG